MGVAAAENYAYNRANGVDPQEALGNAVANGVVEGTVAGLIDQGAKKLVGMCAKPKPEPKLSHPSPKPLPEPRLQPLSEAELEKVVGGAKDPNWRPGGAASAGETKAPRPKSDSQMVVHKAEAKANIERKLEYIFGNATGTQHNIERSLDMERILNKIGIFDNVQGRKIISDALEKAFYSSNGIIQKDGRMLKESLLIGPNGVIKMSSIWKENNLITVFLYDGGWISIF